MFFSIESIPSVNVIISQEKCTITLHIVGGRGAILFTLHSLTRLYLSIKRLLSHSHLIIFPMKCGHTFTKVIILVFLA